MLELLVVGFLIIGAGNFTICKFGFSNFKTGEKDILFPFSSAILFFFSIIISLPQVHAKIEKLQKQQFNGNQLQIQKEQEHFPIVFLLSLLTISLAVFIDKFFINKSDSLKKDEQRNLRNSNQASSVQNNNNQNIIKEQTASLKYFLPIAILFINFYNTYLISLQNIRSQIISEMLAFLFYSLILNFSFGFLLAWSQIQQGFKNYILIFPNIGLVLGVIFSLTMEISSQIAILYCIGIGFAIYTSVFICLPKIFTNGQDAVQDRFRYSAYCIAFLLTLIYYPIIYLLKI